MKISIATNFDSALIDGVKDYGVTNLFGKLTDDFVGGGLETDLLNNIDKEKIAGHVAYAHKNGITMNYTFNSPCLANDEYTIHGKKELANLLDWISEIGVDSITVSIPVVMRYVKKYYPNLQVKVSSSVCVDSVAKAKRWEEMGADCIVLDPMVINRDFEVLKAIREAIPIDLELIVNNNCMYECPFLTYHQSFMGHSSRGDDKEKPDFDYCYLNCSYKRVSAPVNYLISDIIRPEDLKFYEEIGYDNFKIIDRATPTSVMINRVKAYYHRYFDGNLLELIQHYGYRDMAEPEEFINNIYIDNRKLDGYFDRFRKEKCLRTNCGSKCTYCYNYAKKAITINPQFQKHVMEKVSQAIEQVENFGSSQALVRG
ncbi:U32 family peptidase [Paenibacillus rhizophilus]|uniref:Peptidase U32 n=1 Tax=Paenibacillus rhizophilus TaxID=1850366 RepID=A0A3N9PDP7_9BACL|nr:U32 family peptidase [Paenibacillus rhizophilus]RQW13427.1 peptidase U32 [Paenibacillus rhizophilus]